MNKLDVFLREYLRERPLFLSVIRAKEAYLFQDCLPLEGPVLDVGCGDGMFAKITFANNLKSQISKLKTAKERLIDVRHLEGGRLTPLSGGSDDSFKVEESVDVGLDVKGSRVEEARILNIYKKIVIYDGGKMPFTERSFNTVVSNCVLEHIPNLPLTVSEVYRVLKPGGIFLTTVVAAPWEEYLAGNLLFGNTYKSWMRKKQVHLNINTVTEWDNVFKKPGFRIEKRIGYLSKSACRLIDISHYLSIPSLITYKLCGKWMLFPKLADYIYPVNRLSQIMSENVVPEDSGGIFYILGK